MNSDRAPWHHEIRTTKERYEIKEFERKLNGFEFYNIRNRNGICLLFISRVHGGSSTVNETVDKAILGIRRQRKLSMTPLESCTEYRETREADQRASRA